MRGGKNALGQNISGAAQLEAQVGCVLFMTPPPQCDLWCKRDEKTREWQTLPRTAINRVILL